jgi:hypothetical protein
MWPFTRRATERPPINENWQTGDVAECVGVRWRNPPARSPKQGERGIVLRVHPGTLGVSGRPGWLLDLLDFPGLWDASAFRKVTPPSLTAERAERETAQGLVGASLSSPPSVANATISSSAKAAPTAITRLLLPSSSLDSSVAAEARACSRAITGAEASESAAAAIMIRVSCIATPVVCPPGA